MNAMLFAYVEARELAVQAHLRNREFALDAPSVRERLGRALIALGEQLLTIPARPTAEVRPSEAVRPAA
jgi:hypothetical protein